MDDKKAVSTDSLADAAEIAAMLAKLPEAVRMNIKHVIEGAQLVSEVQKAGCQRWV